MNRFFRLFCFLSVVGLLAASPTLGAELVWVGGDSGGAHDVAISANWSPSGPGDNDSWFINTPYGTTSNYPIFTGIGTTSLNVWDVMIGRIDTWPRPNTDPAWHSTDPGYFEQSGGTLNVNAVLQVGQGNATTLSSFVMTGGVVEKSNIGWTKIGGEGSLAEMTMSGDARYNQAGSAFVVGIDAGSQGTLNVGGSSVLTVNGSLRVGDGATGYVNITGTGKINLAHGGFDALLVGNNGTGELNIGTGSDDPTLMLEGTSSWGDGGWLRLGQGTGSGKITVNSGTVDFSNVGAGVVVIAPNSGNGTWIQNGGLTNLGTNTLFYGEGTAQAKVSLNGGTMAVGSMAPLDWWQNAGSVQASVEFNGGTLKTTTNNADFIHKGDANVAVKIMGGGAIIDTNAHDIGINLPLLHGTGSGVPDGGLIKQGSGTLTLNNASTNYTGPTEVVAGQLTLATGNVEGGDTFWGYNAAPNEITVRPNAVLGNDLTSTNSINANLTLDAKSVLSVSVISTPYALPLIVQDVSAGAGTGPAVIKLNLQDPATDISGLDNAPLLMYASRGGKGTVATYIPWIDSVGQRDLSLTDTLTDGGPAGIVKMSLTTSTRGWQTGAGSWNNLANWVEGAGAGGFVPGVGTHTTDTRAWLADAPGAVPGVVTLDTNVTLSSILLKGGYTVTPAASQTITLESTIAANSLIQSTGGVNVIGADIKMAAGDPVVSVVPGSQLTLSGKLSDLTTSAGLTISGGGTLVTSNAASSYTGPVSVTLTEWSTNYLPSALISLNKATLTIPGASKTITSGLQTIGNNTINVATAGSVLTVPVDNVNNILGDGTLFKVGAGTLVFNSSSAGSSKLGGTLYCNAGDMAIQSTTGATFTVSGQITLGENIDPVGTSSGIMSVNGNANVVVSGQVQVGGYWHGDFSASPRPQGTLTLNDTSTMEVNNWLIVGLYSANGILNVGPSATLKVHNNLCLGFNWGDYTSVYGHGEVNTSGHIVQDSSDRIHIGQAGGTGVWNQNGGLTETTSLVQIAEADNYDTPVYSGGILNLNGGTFQAPGFYVGSTLAGSESLTVVDVNFKGGTLKATRDNASYLNNSTATMNLNVQKNATTNLGAVFDTNGYSIGIAEPLVHSGAAATDGGVTKLGAGTLTMYNNASTYNGGTSIVSGKVVATEPGSLGTGSVKFTASGTALSVGAAVPVATVSGFGGNGTGWTLNALLTNPASVASDVLTITAAQNDIGNSAFFTRKVTTGDFTASFTYQDVSGGGADGFAFVLQKSGPGEVGFGGGGLGYGGIGNSIALEGNIYGGTGMKLGINGSTGGYTSTSPVDLTNKDYPVNVSLAYHDTTDILDVTLTQSDGAGGTNTYSTNYSGVDLSSFSTAYVGFTGGTGGLNAQQNISNFSYSSTLSYTPASTVYTNGLEVDNTVAATVSVLASASQPTVTMGGLSMGTNSTLIVIPETGTPADTAYGLTLAGAATLSGPANLVVVNNGTGTGKLTLAGTLSGTGPLAKQGDGVLELTGPISYTGNVSIASGLVRINNGTTSMLGTVTGAGSLTVASGSTLTVTSLRVGSLAPAAASAVPEPGTLVLLALAGLGMLLAWRRK